MFNKILFINNHYIGGVEFEICFNFLLILFFIAPSVDEAKSIPQVLKAGVYNYITCLDKSVDYLSENYPVFNSSLNFLIKNLILRL
ncbi:hypothetical protein H477_1964 [[Clostridium] sordellii ATCC 9714]|nr:hypothetical protein H477_1964 [[Clostridium] sordellii ATCC 9714] [Paeniclostridium sordellii ATCC 9714]